MDLNTFIVAVFCLIDDRLKQGASHPPAVRLRSSPMQRSLTIEVVGEFLGIDTDKGIYYATSADTTANGFLPLKGVHRTTFCRQAANLWVVKEMLWKHAARPDVLRPRSVLDRQLPGADLPFREGSTAAVSWLKRAPSATTR